MLICQITNEKQLEEWIADYGVGSDFVKVRVLGEFPSASSLQFISRELVNEAQVREVADQQRDTVVLGVDPARFGDDSRAERRGQVREVGFHAWRGATCSCRPSACVTFRMVAKLGLPSPESAL